MATSTPAVPHCIQLPLKEQCYMCDQPATSVEHVPPRCLFPEQKDLPPGVDLRKQLITVPSCDAHNSSKSHDDEYLLYTIVMSLPNNQIGKNHFLTKVWRAIQRNPSLITRMTSKSQTVTAVDESTGQRFETLAVETELKRLHSVLEKLGRALYLHQFGRRWEGRVRPLPHFLLSMDSVAQNDRNETQDRMIQAMVSAAPKFGANPEAFYYQVVDGLPPVEKIMLMTMYEGSRTTLLFGR